MDAWEFIDRFRAAKDWTWTQLAKELGLSVSYFSNLRASGTRPRQEVVNALADMLSDAGFFASELERLSFKDALNNLHLQHTPSTP